MSSSNSPKLVCSYQQEADALQRFFVRPFFLSLTIGIPFCIFKMLFGHIAVQVGTPVDPFLIVFGWLIICWACVDLFMNAGRSLLDMAHRSAPFEYCSIAQIGRIVQMPMVFLAFDTFLSFTIICVMLWTGWIARLTFGESVLWYMATTLNLISLSFVSVYNEIRKM